MTVSPTPTTAGPSDSADRPIAVTAIAAPSTLDRLLDAELDFDPVAEHGFTNHLAMGLTAAARLGADSEALQRWYDREVSSGSILPRTPRPDWLATDTARIERTGISAAVESMLPLLVERIGGLFHWMIRLDLAIDAGHTGQVANALGDWGGRRSSGYPFPEPSGTASIPDTLDAIAAAAAGSDTGRGEHLAVVEQQWLRELVAAAGDVGDGDALLAEIAVAVADLHWAADEFVTLHMVTGTRAARAVAPFLDADHRLVLARGHLLAIGAARARASAPRPQPASVPDAADLADWDRIASAAVASRDDHVVKLAYACRLEQAATGRGVYQAIAARVAGLL